MTTPLDTYRKEFPSADQQIEPLVLAFLAGLGFTDQSWHNDMCPSFLLSENKIAVYIDCADREKREFPEAERFSIHPIDDDGQIQDDPMPETFEDFEQLAARLRKIVGE
ncbi:MAG: hypothetical protein WCP82_05075 [Alphaproteobacteria bacterium]